MLPGLELMGCQNLAVPAEVMRHVVGVESGANSFAIGVVGARLVRQPKNLDEAVATANMLEAKGYNYSLGLAQVNRVNFAKYGLDTPAKAFGVCTNLSVGARILADCYHSANRDWGKAFSCYYSGNFITGFLQGYVQKIYGSILRSAQQAQAAPASPGPAAATLASSASAYAVAISTAYPHNLLKTYPQIPPAAAAPVRPSRIAQAPDTAAQRIAMRTTPVNLGNNGAAFQATPPALSAISAINPAAGSRPAADAAPSAAARPGAAPDIFVPQVRGPHDPPLAPTAGPQQQAGHDSAFVF